MRTTYIKKILILGLLVVFVAGLASCDMAEDINGDLDEELEPTKVGVVFTLTGLGDLSFNDMTYRGLQEAENDMNVEFDYAEPENAEEFPQLMENYAESDYDIVIGVGYQMAAHIDNVSRNYPEVKFVQIDSSIDGPSENVTTISFDVKEGSFLAGALSGLVSNTDNVGFVGGYEDVNAKFQSGFEQGVNYIDNQIETQVKYANDFGNPEKGEDIATEMIESGADVIFHAAGGTGMGVFDAVENEEEYAIGVDANQNYIAPGYTIASMMKRVDNSVYDVIEAYQKEKFPGGENIVHGLDDNGVGLTDLAEITSEVENVYENGNISEEQYNAIENMKDNVTSQYADEIAEIENKIINGEITIE